MRVYLAFAISLLPGLIGMISDRIAARTAGRCHDTEAAITRREHHAAQVRRYTQARGYSTQAARHHRNRLNRCTHSRRRIRAA